MPLVYGPGARDAGARCDQIPETVPGVGYVGLDGVREPVRVRFTHVTDDHIARLATTYASTGTRRGTVVPGAPSVAGSEDAA